MHGHTSAEIGILGGTGLYDLPGLEDARDLELETPFGAQPCAWRLGKAAKD